MDESRCHLWCSFTLWQKSSTQKDSGYSICTYIEYRECIRIFSVSRAGCLFLLCQTYPFSVSFVFLNSFLFVWYRLWWCYICTFSECIRIFSVHCLLLCAQNSWNRWEVKIDLRQNIVLVSNVLHCIVFVCPIDDISSISHKVNSNLCKVTLQEMRRKAWLVHHQHNHFAKAMFQHSNRTL